MVVDNVHDHAKTLVVEAHNHLLEFIDSHFAVEGVC